MKKKHQCIVNDSVYFLCHSSFHISLLSQKCQCIIKCIRFYTFDAPLLEEAMRLCDYYFLGHTDLNRTHAL